MTLPVGRLLPDLVARAELAWPERVAAAFPGETWTYAEIAAGARRQAAELAGRGVGPGDHVGTLIHDGPAQVEVILACWLLGAVPVPFHVRSRAEELSYLLGHSDVVGLVVGGPQRGARVDVCARVEGALPDIAPAEGGHVATRVAPHLRFVLCDGTPDRPWLSPRRAAEPATPVPAPPVTWDSPALMLYTSGTTSRPKGCVLTQRSLVSVCVGVTQRLELGPEDVVWSPTALFHIAAFVCLIGSLAVGAEYVGAARFEPEAALELIVDRSVTVAYGVFPPFYTGIASAPRFDPGRLPRLRVVTTAASPDEIDRVRRDFPHATQISVYGSTDVSGTVCLNALTDSAAVRRDTCGRPLDGVEISIRDTESGRELAVGSVGEIWIRGSCVLGRYHGEPRAPVDDSGWFHTGDLGERDADGNVGFRGRLKDMLKVGGENVSPREIEDVLMSTPGVVLAHVVGRLHSRLGEAPVAFVEAEAGVDLDVAELRRACEQRLAGFKVPHDILLVEEWPRSVTKVDKHALRARLLDDGRAA